MHLHGHKFLVTGSDGGRWPQSIWRPEVTEIIGVGQTRDLEFIANPLGVDQSGLTEKMRSLLPGYMAMGKNGMAEHSEHLSMNASADHSGMHHGSGLSGPRNTLPMMTGTGPFGPLEMGGMFTVVKVRDQITDENQVGWYDNPRGTIATRINRT